MLSDSTEQCLTEDKRCRCGVKKGGTLFFFFPPVALFMGFRWWQGCLYERYPNFWNLLGLQISACKFHEDRTIFQDGAWWLGEAVTKISCTSCFRVAGNEAKTVFQDFSTWSQLESGYTDVQKEGTRVQAVSHTNTQIPTKGHHTDSQNYLFNLFKTHIQYLPIK